MDKVPLEIWTEIFALACVDGGPTGCSLSLVSRYFHDISMPTRFHSVSLKWWWSILRLAYVLSNTPPDHRQIKHLFIALSSSFSHAPDDEDEDYVPSDDSSSDTSSDGSDGSEADEGQTDDEPDGEVVGVVFKYFRYGAEQGRGGYFGYGYGDGRNWRVHFDGTYGEGVPSSFSAIDKEWEELDQHVSSALRQIIELVAPSLQTLSIIELDRSLDLVPVPFPSLLEIMVTTSRPFLGKVNSLTCPTLLPSLRRFYALSPWTISHFAAISHAAPSLTHLRLPFNRYLLKNGPLLGGRGNTNIIWSLPGLVVMDATPQIYGEYRQLLGEGEYYFEVAREGIVVARWRPTEVGDLEREWMERMAGAAGLWAYEAFPLLEDLCCDSDDASSWTGSRG